MEDPEITSSQIVRKLHSMVKEELSKFNDKDTLDVIINRLFSEAEEKIEELSQREQEKSKSTDQTIASTSQTHECETCKATREVSSRGYPTLEHKVNVANVEWKLT